MNHYPLWAMELGASYPAPHPELRLCVEVDRSGPVYLDSYALHGVRRHRGELG